MGWLVLPLLLVVMGGGLVFRHSWRQERVEWLRDRARLRVIEGQLATLRAALRIGVAEHFARRQFIATHNRDHENW